MYRQYAHVVICIDSTHKTNAYDFRLVTLLVVVDYGEGMHVHVNCVPVCVHVY